MSDISGYFIISFRTSCMCLCIYVCVLLVRRGNDLI